MNHNSNLSPARQRAAAGLLLFAVPFAPLVTKRGIGICSLLFLAAALLLVRQGRAQLALHWPALRPVVLAFAAYAVLALLLLLRPGSEGMNAEKPVRMLLAFAALPVVLVCQPDRRWLWGGVAAGAVAAALLLAQQRFGLGIERPGGLVNPITAGDLLICLALLSLAAASEMHGKLRALAALGALAGIGGALLTGTRGCLVALAAGAAIYIWQMRATRWARVVAAGFAVLCAALWFIPATGVQARFDTGVSEVLQYGEQRVAPGAHMATSSMGQRLELWRAAALLVPERPLLGGDYATVRAALEEKVARGVLHPEVLPREHFHNDALQALVFGGVAGFGAWLAILVAPLAFFTRRLRGPAPACALAGVLLVTSFLAFGLTEVIFWSMRANLFYALMVSMLMGLCLNAKEHDGK